MIGRAVIQHADILERVEKQADNDDKVRLAEAEQLLRSDLWSIDCRLDLNPDDAEQRAAYKRASDAIDKIVRKLGNDPLIAK